MIKVFLFHYVRKFDEKNLHVCYNQQFRIWLNAKFKKLYLKISEVAAIKVFVFDIMQTSKGWMFKEVVEKISEIFEVSDLSKFSIWPTEMM